jgi:hypothetical protein
MKIQNVIDKVREWLKHNKIFFETLVIVLVSIMAVAISWGAYQTTVYQSQIMEKQNMPIFNIELQPKWVDYHSEFGPTDSISIENLGEPITEFQFESLVMINFTNLLNNKNFYITLPMYYTVIPDDQSTYKWHSVGGIGVYKAVSSIIDNLTTYSQQYFISPKVNLERYFKINYRDKLGIQRANYYYLDQNEGERQLSYEEGTEVEKIYDNMNNLRVVNINFDTYGLNEKLTRQAENWITNLS